ncbi:Major Facilitator Superfamily protein [Streptomyces fradiae ATCC 10745 = DSM 40063]|uniref:Major Facilitator Superfamily protein n=1 Tax=Streptomyces fradiae ATCC 10745 = DSM 40063 TaxID=1319510 RepID=A0A1Y2P0C8_STRFR|nr:Major Facilitator Superfamily protein [Streptomyces fradiae ATCC 10745 = DSM 40063]
MPPVRERHALARYAAGAALARTGDEMAGPALLLAGLAATGSTATASALLAASTAAAAVGGPAAGALLDRSPRPGRLLAAALAGYAAGLVAVLVCLGRTPVAVPLLIAAASGLLAPALSGGWSAQLPRVAVAPHLPRATALDAMTFHAAALAGPALTAAAAMLHGAGAAVLTAAALLALAATATPRPSATASPRARVRPGHGLPADRSQPSTHPGGGAAGPVRSAPRPERSVLRPERSAPRPERSAPRPGRPAASPEGPARQPAVRLAAGFRALTGTPVLARVTGASVLSCAAQGLLVACTPLLGARHLGGAGHGALLLAVLAAAALAANALYPLYARLRTAPGPEAVFRAATLVQAAALPLVAVAGHPAVLLAAVALAGAGEGPQLTALFAVRDREAPPRLRGRVFTTGASLKTSGFALGAAAAGPLAERSLPGALLAAAVAQAVAA